MADLDKDNRTLKSENDADQSASDQSGASQEMTDEVNDDIPSELFRTIVMSAMLGIILIVFSLVFSFIMHTTWYAAGIVMGGFFLVRSILIRYGWKSGKIEEKCYRCVSCQYSKRRNCYLVVCAGIEDGSSSLYDFQLSKGGEIDMLAPGSYVLFYLNRSNPKNPVAWRLI